MEKTDFTTDILNIIKNRFKQKLIELNDTMIYDTLYHGGDFMESIKSRISDITDIMNLINSDINNLIHK